MRRKTFLLFVFAAAVIGGAWWWQRPPSDPVYEGQRLSEWVYQIGKSSTPRELTREDIKAMGPAAIVWLSHAVEHGRYPLRHARDDSRATGRERLRELGRKWLHLRLDDDYDERVAAARVLQIMEADAAPAIPALLRAVDTAERDQKFAALAALDAIGAAARPAMLQALADGPLLTRMNIAYHLPSLLRGHERVTTDVEYGELLAALCKACRNSEPDVRLAAVESIGTCSMERPFDPNKEPVATALAALLSDSDAKCRVAAAVCLTRFGPDASNTIPRLVELLTDADDDVSGAVAQAIHRIDPTDTRVVPRFQKMLNDPKQEFRSNARASLRAFGEWPVR